MAYCIAGHHTGIPDGGYKSDELVDDEKTLNRRLHRNFQNFSMYKDELDLLNINEKEILTFLMQDCGNSKEVLIDKFAFLTVLSK